MRMSSLVLAALMVIMSLMIQDLSPKRVEAGGGGAPQWATFTLPNIQVNPGTKYIDVPVQATSTPVDGVDVVIQYDPTVLRLVDMDNSRPGVQAVMGNCPLPWVLHNDAPWEGAGEKGGPATDKIYVSAGRAFYPNAPVQLNCTLATLRFVPLTKGTSALILVPQIFDKYGVPVNDGTLAANNGQKLPLELINGQVTVGRPNSGKNNNDRRK